LTIGNTMFYSTQLVKAQALLKPKYKA
jgi:hypothetical protein